MALGNLSAGLEEAISEPFEEYVKYSVIAQRALKHRTSKHLQLERASELLEAKKSGLERLELAEQESKRLAAALQRETEARDPYSDDESLYPDDEIRRSRSAAPQVSGQAEENDPEERRESGRSYSTGDVTQTLNSSGGGHLLNLLSYTLHGLIDVDPEGSRRSSITKTKEQILGLESLVESMSNGLELTSAALQRDLDRFQTQKQNDLNKALADLARLHMDYCRANLQAWEEALAEAEKIPTGNIPCRAFITPKSNPEPLDP
ncbi:Sorting nexin, cytoplasm-to-vacuole targeting pathway/endosomal sorting [Entomophthora muscae]|uniref:Sorting nexin, cytoplasm-to-vacuole targeting pathway/endosomal sorting n=1 Tax=Entomophthora muscae TaxID=34485 RepID=A0ACC2TES7_9FUNG|nr:Sorting nexin, cytoplasm-to-vacuole targeting pathway/endosomal sorting [Entomophthora muscae]